jgi:deoxyribose-phosphate aldolase
MTPSELAKSIDQSLLKPDVSIDEVVNFCEEAKKYNFACVYVNPIYVRTAYDILKNTPIKVGTVIAFPFGATTTEVKVFEADDAIDRGASEIDMVINIGALKSGQPELVYSDIRSVVELARRKEVERGHDIVVKVIIETGYLVDEEKRMAARLVERAAADFVKTSTGFGPTGATVEDVELIRSEVSFDMGIKASGGIRALSQAIALLDAGANRLGTSAGVQIMEELLMKQGKGTKSR